MKQTLKVVTAEILDENYRISLHEICEKNAVTVEFVNELVELGLIEPIEKDQKDMVFDSCAFKRIYSAIRLHRDLHINQEGIAVIIEMLDELQQLRQRLSILEE